MVGHFFLSRQTTQPQVSDDATCRVPCMAVCRTPPNAERTRLRLQLLQRVGWGRRRVAAGAYSRDP